MWAIGVIAGIGGSLLIVGATVAIFFCLSAHKKRKSLAPKEPESPKAPETVELATITEGSKPEPTQPKKQEEPIPVEAKKPEASEAAAATPTSPTTTDALLEEPKKEGKKKKKKTKKAQAHRRVAFNPPTDASAVVFDAEGSAVFVLGKDPAGNFLFSDAGGNPLSIEVDTETKKTFIIYNK